MSETFFMNFNFFLPKQPIFFELFIKLSGEILNISGLLKELSRLKDLNELKIYAAQADEIEHRADDITHEVVMRLNKTFITPFDREDIYTLAGEFDDVVDKIENVIHNLVIYEVSPKEEFIAGFAQIIGEAAQALNQLTSLLPEQKYSDSFRSLVLKIHNLEDDGDELFLNTLRRLFQNGQNPVVIIKLKDIAEDLERVVDKFQAASNILENIVVKSS